VYRCKPVGSDKVCVLKMVDKREVEKDGVVHQLKREVEIHSRCRHENIVRFYCYFQDKERLFMVLEYCNGKSIYDALQASSEGRFADARAHGYFVQVLAALEYLRTDKAVPIMHRDIKPENLLLHRATPDGPEVVKLADFGWAVDYVPTSVRTTLCGTPDYLPPEVIEGKRYAGAFDLWTLGILLFEMLCGRAPFAADDHSPDSSAPDSSASTPADPAKATMDRIVKGHFDIPDFVDPRAADLIRKLLHPDPDHRIRLPDVHAHPWVTRTS
jgi:serine/threonine protein kinase